MLRGKRTRKGIALTFLVILLTNTLAPLSAYALTSGPTAPEATSFEPVDTTDMVNLLSGDLTYNIPLLEVPGPEGGYPLSLSYHAGIQPNEDASWVGLGWTLNPGAINRSVNGYPDDWYGPQGSSHVYWDGGVRETYSVGVSVGLPGPVGNVSFGLSFSTDTYQGFGVGMNMGLNFKLGKEGANSPFGASIGVGIDPYGGAYVSGGLSVSDGEGGLSASAGIGFSTNFESVNASVSGGIGYSYGKPDSKGRHRSTSLLGASISTGGGKPSLEVGGLSASISSSTVAQVQTKTKGFGADIPVLPGVNVSLGYKKTKYWTNEKTNVYTHGSMHYSTFMTYAPNLPDNRAYDSYSLLEKPEEKNIVDYPDPTKLQGGSYLDFDVYNVMAQGLAGSMRPYMFQAQVVGQNKKNESGNYEVRYYSPGPESVPQFRFVNDFSNSYRQEYPVYTDENTNLAWVSPPFASPVYGDNDGNYGYAAPNRLAGSRHIELGAQIQPSNISGYDPNYYYSYGMIGGFSITNESGVTYHYGLPAYVTREEVYQQKINGTLLFNRQTKSQPYAYTWYLTSITGPDFVDRDNDGKAGYNDWGYWVNFEYGKWSAMYTWRNPSEGYHRDEDNEWKNCSMGNKEVYYLNAVRTRSHIALFEKDIRYDGKGSSQESFNTHYQNGAQTQYQNEGLYNVNSAQSLRLSKIYLLNTNNYYNEFESSNTLTVGTGGTNTYVPSGRTVYCPCEWSGNVLDKSDIETAGRAKLEANALRVIDFNHDYSLCEGTTNSFSTSAPATKLGKLSLKSLQFRGKQGLTLIPPIKFEYELSGDDLKSGSGTVDAPSASVSNLQTSTSLEKGDILKVGSSHYAVITETPLTSGNGQYKIRWLNGFGNPSAGSYSISTTKNPPYNKDAYDLWGMYKSDIIATLLSSNENLGRTTTPISAKGTDAWSLRKITSSLGGEIKINYESDKYVKSALNESHSMVLSNIQVENINSNPHTAITFNIQNPGYNLSDLIPVNSTGDFLAKAIYECFSTQCAIPGTTRMINSKYTVTSIDGNGTVHATLNPGIPDNLGGGYPTFSLTEIPIGNISVAFGDGLYGGGIRVKKITTKFNNAEGSTEYNYNNPVGQGSSGVTSYQPSIFDVYDYTMGDNAYKQALYKDIHTLLAISREVPAPGVMYEYVTVTSEVKNADEGSARPLEGKVQYQFEVFRENMISRERTQNDITGSAGSYGAQYIRSWALKKFNAGIGNLKRTVQYDDKGKKISETINHYLHDGLEKKSPADFFSNYKTRLADYKYQGFLQERLSEVKVVSNSGANDGTRATYAAREEYPSIQTGQTVINYVNGTQVKSENLGFDFYSGAVTKTVETDAYGNRYMTEVIPAYRKYSALGLKVSDGTNKNMLTQTAETHMFKVDGSNNKLGLVSAQAQTWSNAVPALSWGTAYTQNGGTPGSVWRMQSSYSWLPDNKTTDGMTSIGSFSDFNFTTPSSSNANWKKTSEITLYDVYSHALEAVDINGNYAATRMDHGSNKVILSGGPAKYYEMAYSGVEESVYEFYLNYTEFVKKIDGVESSVTAHSGVTSLKLGTSGKKGLVYSVNTDKLTIGRNYVAFAWVKPASGSPSNIKLYYSINNVEQAAVSTSTKTANGWTLLSLSIPGSSITSNVTLEVGCRNDNSSVEAYVDDFRFQPQNAATTAYVYDNFSGELTYVLDNNNLYTKFDYDAAGRLTKSYKEKLGQGMLLASEFNYNYSATKFLSAPINQQYSKNNCLAGYTAVPVTINYPQGKTISYTNQLDADQQAQFLAQLEANRLGTCIPPSTIYVRIENEPSGTYWDGCIYDVRIYAVAHFYADANGTIPLDVSEFGVLVNWEIDNYWNGTSSNYPMSTMCWGTSTILFDYTQSYNDYCTGDYGSQYIYLLPATTSPYQML